MSAAGTAWSVVGSPSAQRYRLLVAELDGRVVGSASVGLAFDSSVPGQSFADPMVHPAARGRGAGRALLAEAERYLAGLGATEVFTWALTDEPSLDFARRCGYRPLRTARYLSLELTEGALPPRAPAPPGVELRPATGLTGDPWPLYEANNEAVRDEPNDIAVDAMPYQDWLALDWNDPDLDRSLSTVALVGGEVVAFSLVHTDGRGGCLSRMTGTRRAHRGRGLAKLAKNHALHLARAAGCTRAYTGNDTGNGPMLAVNRWFGYRPAGAEQRFVRALGAPR
ncbi:GNAT family N-acetyltransferase [Streptomyces palmae]|uniref:GNAT family N-acetyltransferase n=2 Tax=Streptomyces palmae TaxID=1701085 RepID=A0A4Z0GGQ5_9ACTN|nr:GNAT family N-acetyltransferase [Streptomyces palmae]